MSQPFSTTQRRRRLKEAVLAGSSQVETGSPRAEHGTPPLRAVEGVIIDASPHLLVLTTAAGAEVRMPMSGTTSIWHGGAASSTALLPGRTVVVRPTGSGLVAGRVWVDIVRVTGVITKRTHGRIEVDAGPHRGPLAVVIPERALSRVQVRHPKMEPGFLLDVIGIRGRGEAVGLIPATSQSACRPDQSLPCGHYAGAIHGTATWFEAPRGSRGAAYPALDPWGDAGGCPDTPRSCAELPYLSLGSEPHVRNDCSGRASQVPIIECGCLAAHFCDRCVHCDTSPRGRIVELTKATFVDLGGDLDEGCFNVTVRVPGSA